MVSEGVVNFGLLINRLDGLAEKDRYSFFKAEILPNLAYTDPGERDRILHKCWLALKSQGIKEKSLRTMMELLMPENPFEDEPKGKSTSKGRGATKQTHTDGDTENPAPAGKLPSIYDEWLRLLDQTGYLVDQAGYLCYLKKERDGDYPVPVANFLARPIREVTRDDGRETERTFEIVGLLSPGGIPLPPATIPARQFGSMTWVPEKWGLSAGIMPGRGAVDRVRHSIQCLARDIPKETIFTHLGWRRFNGGWCYLYAGGAVGSAGLAVEPGEGLHRYALPGQLDPAAMAESLALLDLGPPEVVIPLWAAVWLAPLCEPMRQAGIEPAFTLWLYGESGSLKSTLAALILSHYGSFEAKNLPGSFKDTDNGLERRGFLAKDVLLVVDDYHPSADRLEAQKMRKTAGVLLRSYGDRVGRTRMRADTTIREGYPPRGLLLVTGEDLPEGSQSATARFLKVDLRRGDVDLALLTQAQAQADRLAAAMRGYLEWLVPKLDALVDKLRARFLGYRQKATTEGQHGRLPEAVAWLYVGLHAGLDYAAEMGAVTPDRRKELLAEGWQVLMSLAEAQGRLIEEERPSKRFLDLVREILSSGTGYVVDLRNVRPDAYQTDGPASRPPGFLGWRDADYYYLLPEVVFKTVVQFAQQQGGHFPVTSRTLWKHLGTDGIIAAEKSGGRWHTTRQKKIGGQNLRVLWLKVATITAGDDDPAADDPESDYDVF